MAEKKQEAVATDRSAKRTGGPKAAGTADTSKAPTTNGQTAARPASKSSAKSASGGTQAAARTKKPDLRKDLRDFASARPEGWGHEDWLAFLEDLQKRGHNVSDREAIGMALEKERLDLALGKVKGLNPQRRQSLVEKYGTLWGLRDADSDEIAASAQIPRDLVDRIKQGMS
jgi:hypothetical protein